MMRRIAFAVLLLVGGAAPALANEQSEVLVRDFIRWIDSSRDWRASVSVVRSDGADTLAEGVVLTRARPNVSISIETLRLKGLVEREEGGFKADEIELANADIVSQDLRYTIPSATVEAVSTPVMEGFSFDPSHLMTSLAKAHSALAKAEFSKLSIPEMTGTSERSSQETGETTSVRLVYRDLSVDGLKDGVAVGLKAGPVSTHVISPGGNADFVISSVVADRMDIGAFAHVFDPAAYEDGKGDRVWRPILSNVTYSGISAYGPDGFTLKLDNLALEKLDGRQLDKPFTPTWDRLLDLTVPEEDKPGLALDLFRSYAAWRLGALRLDGLKIDMPAEKASFALDDLSVSGLSSEGIDSLIVRGVDGKAPDGFLKLASLELEGFVSPDLEAMVQFAALESNIDPKMHAEAIAKTFAGMPRLSHLGVSDVVAGKTQADAISLEGLTLDFRLWNDIFAEATDIKLTGLDVPPRLLGPDTAKMIDTLGYDDLVLGVTLSDRWTPETGIDDATWVFTLGGAADVQLTYKLTGVTRDWLLQATAAAGDSKNSDEAVKAMLETLKLERATLSVTDRSLLERGFAFAAQMQNLDVDGRTYREQMRAALPFLISAAMPPAITRLLSKPLQQFLAGDQKLVAEIAPPAPLNVTEFLAHAKDPLELPERLNMTLRTEAPTD